ncbi:MAG: carbon-nitrogen hydrolase family protein [Saprospiraceae bacterium]|nr:carbon-nitrogen hydrolase family protein [Saprospiraceae bacterium]
MKSDSYRLAMVQMLVEPGNLDGNLTRAAQRIGEAASAGAKIAVLPEVMDLGWTHPSAKNMSFTIPQGKTCQTLMAIARRHAIYICAGIVEKEGANIYNAAILIDPGGEVLLKHRKVNELEIAHEIYQQGTSLNVISTDLGTIGLQICADALARKNTLSFSLGYMGADIILSPCAWAVPPDFDQNVAPYGDLWRDVYIEVSSHFDLWIIGVSNVGPISAGAWQGWNCIGNSLAFSPGGHQKHQAPFGSSADTIEYIDVLLQQRPARGTQWDTQHM